MTHVSEDELIDVMHELRKAGTPFVVATVIGARGSTPRKAGAKMVVAGDGRSFGTVGGGAVEAKVHERARAVLASPAVDRFTWELGSADAGGMVCGGTMEFLIEPFGVRPPAFVFGGGHVGKALCRALVELRFDVTVVDDREALLTGERLPGARLVTAAPMKAAAELALPPSAFAIIVTRGHSQDLETLRALVGKDLRYLGLMGSRKKKVEIFDALRAEGVPDAVLGRVHCPVGLDVGAESPEEIAVAIAAEMIATLHAKPALASHEP